MQSMRQDGFLQPLGDLARVLQVAEVTLRAAVRRRNVDPALPVRELAGTLNASLGYAPFVLRGDDVVISLL